MGLSNSQKVEIRKLLVDKITEKLKTYSRETSSMPFLAKLMQDEEKVAAYSFIHSLSTTLGMSIYEQIAKIIASENFDKVETSFDVDGTISDGENLVISKILQEIKSKKRLSNKENEITEILNAKNSGGRNFIKRCDLYLKKGDNEYFIEIKTAKPNIDVFTESKRKLLEWVALRKRKVTTFIAIPYNPYHPEPYDRFTVQGVLDIEHELYVGEKFWNFLGGQNTFKELLDLFDFVGKELKDKINKKIEEVAKTKMKI